MEADSLQNLVIEDKQGIGTFAVDSISFKIGLAPYLATDKIRVDVIDMKLNFDKEPKMVLNTTRGANVTSPDF